MLSYLIVPSTPSAADDLVIPQRFFDQQPDWQPCDFNYSVLRRSPAAPVTNCTQVRVPLDWSNPDASPDIWLAIAFSSSNTGSERLLLADPGGYGVSTRAFTTSLGIDNRGLVDGFDLLGWDRRGSGQSSRLTCEIPASAVTPLTSAADPRQRNIRNQAAETAEARLLAGACAPSAFVGFITSAQMAADLRFLVAFLGYQKLNYLGYGNSAPVGAQFAARFPEQTDRVVLDSWATPDSAAEPTQRRVDQFFDWLARTDAKTWGATRAAVAARYETMRDALARRRLDSFQGYVWQLDTAIRLALASDAGFGVARSAWQLYQVIADQGEDRLSTEQVAALSGLRRSLLPTVTAQLDMIRSMAAKLDPSWPVDLGPIVDAARCNDAERGGSPQDRLDAADRAAEKYPFTGYRTGVNACSYWQFGPTAQPDLTQLRSNVLFVQSAAGPYSDYQYVKDQIWGRTTATLVTVADSGQHALSFTGRSGCTDAVLNRFLIQAQNVASQVCQATPLPGETKVFPTASTLDAPGASAPAVTGRAEMNPLLESGLEQAAARS